MFTVEEVLEEVLKEDEVDVEEQVNRIDSVHSIDDNLTYWIECFSGEGKFDKDFFRQSALEVMRPILRSSAGQLKV